MNVNGLNIISQSGNGWLAGTGSSSVLTATHLSVDPGKTIKLQVKIQALCGLVGPITLSGIYNYTSNGVSANLTPASASVNISDVSILVDYPPANDNTVPDFLNSSMTNTKDIRLIVSGNDLTNQPFGVKINMATTFVDVTAINSISYGSGNLIAGTNYTATIVAGTASTPGYALINFTPNFLQPVANNDYILIKASFKAKECLINKPEQKAIIQTFKNCANDLTCNKGSNELFFKWKDVQATGLVVTESSNKAFNLCGGKSKVRITYSNTGATPYYDLGLYLSQYGTDITNATINGVSVALVANNTSYLAPNAVPGFTSTGGNANAMDLQPNQIISLEFDYAPAINTNLCNGMPMQYHSVYLYKKDSECSEQTYIANNFPIQLINNSSVLTGDNDITPLAPKTINLATNINLLNGDLMDANFKLSLEVTVPCGTSIDNSSPIQFIRANLPGEPANMAYPDMVLIPQGTPVTNADGSLTYKLIAQNYYRYSVVPLANGSFTPFYNGNLYLHGNVNFKVKLVNAACASCTASAIQKIKANVSIQFEQCPNNPLKIACTEKDFYTHCSQTGVPGSCDNVQNPLWATGFNAIRTTFGYTDATMSQQITLSAALANTGINLKGAYACDMIRTISTGKVLCNKTGNYYTYVWFDVPAGATPSLNLLSASARLNNNATTINGLNFIRMNGSVAGTTNMETPTRVVYRITLNNITVVQNTTIEVECNFKVDEAINSAPYSAVNAMSSFRSGFSENAAAYPIEHYGDNMDLYQLKITSTHNYINGTCGYNLTTQKQISVTGGTSGDDFPNEYRPVFPPTGNLTINIPAAFQNDLIIDNIKLNPSTGGSFNLTFTQSGNIYTANPPAGGWKGFEKNSPYTYSYIVINYHYRTCISQYQDIGNINTSLNYTDQCNTVKTLSDNLNYSIQPLLPNAFKVQSINNSVNAIGANTQFELQISNPTTQIVYYPWIKITYPANLLSLSISNNTAFNGATVINSNGVTFIKLNQFNSGNTDVREFLNVQPLDCSTNQAVPLQLEYGISCNPITGNSLSEIDLAGLCSRGTQDLIVNLLKSDLGMDVFTFFNKEEPQEACKPLKFLVQVFDAEMAGILNPKLNVLLPTGYQLTGIKYHTPLQVAEIINTGAAFNPASINLNNFTAASGVSATWPLQGLTANTLSGIAGNTSNTERKNFYHILVEITPDCNIQNTDPIKFSVSGSTPCNETITRESVQNIKIKGLENLNNYSYTLTSQVNASSDCKTFTLNLQYNSTVGMPAGTIAYLTISLPSPLTATGNTVLGPLPTVANTPANYSITFTAPENFCDSVTINAIVKMTVKTQCTNSTCDLKLEFKNSFKTKVCCTLPPGCKVTPSMTIINGTTDNPCFDLDCKTIVVTNTTNLTGSGYHYGTVDWVITNASNGNVVYQAQNPGNNVNGLVYQFSNNGTYNVCMTLHLLDDNGGTCVKILCKEVKIACDDCKIEGSFIQKGMNPGPCDIMVIPQLTTSAPVSSYTWNILDASNTNVYTTSGTGNPSGINYNFANGTYTVQLIVIINTPEGECKKVLTTTVTGVCCDIDKFDFKTGRTSKTDCYLWGFFPSTLSNTTGISYVWEVLSNNSVIWTSSTQNGQLTDGSFNFPADGTYTVRLTVSKSISGKICNKQIVEHEVVIDCCAIEKFGFSIETTKICNQFNFVPSLLPNITGISYLWQVIDPNGSVIWSSVVQNGQLGSTAYTFANDGVYTVRLTVIKSNNGKECKREISEQTVKVYCKNVPCKGGADFIIQPIKGCVFEFNDNSYAGLGCTIYSWSWNVGEGTIISDVNADPRNITVDFSNVSSLTQSVTLTIIVNTPSSSCVFEITKKVTLSKSCFGFVKPTFSDPRTGFNKLMLTDEQSLPASTEVQLFPNPTEGKFTVKFPEDCLNCKISVANPEGSVLFEKPVDSTKMEIDLSNETTGIYILTIKGQGYFKTIRVNKL